jgi:hypothetical protein
MFLESHPDWVKRIEQLRSKRHDSIRIANERQRLKVKAIMAEYDYALKNISDEFHAAENEIIDEFTTKRKRKIDSTDYKGIFHNFNIIYLVLTFVIRSPIVG